MWVRWRVGDGNSIYVHSDPWISREENFYLEDGLVFIPNATWVCDLFVTGERRWDVFKIMNLFSINDIRRILSILLSLCANQDKLLWYFDWKGFYTIKTVYHLAYHFFQQRIELEGLHGDLWKLDVPPKIRDFIWRVGRNVLLETTWLEEELIFPHNVCFVKKRRILITSL